MPTQACARSTCRTCCSRINRRRRNRLPSQRRKGKVAVMQKFLLFILLLSIPCACGNAAELPAGAPAIAPEMAGFGGVRQIVDVAAGQPFARALHVRVAQVPEHPYSIQTGAPTTVAIAK